MSSARDVLRQRAVRQYLVSTAFGSIGLNLMVTVLFKQAYDMTGDAIGGTVLQLGWSKDLIVAQRRATFGGKVEWVVVDVKRREVSGPFTEQQIRERPDLAKLTLHSADSAWRRL